MKMDLNIFQVLLVTIFIAGTCRCTDNKENYCEVVHYQSRDVHSGKLDSSLVFKCRGNIVKENSFNFHNYINLNESIAIGKAWMTPIPEGISKSNLLKNGFEYYSGFGFYKLHKEVVNWSTARRICQDEDSYLSIANSQAEANLFVRIFQEKKDETISNRTILLLGFHDLFAEGDYVTIKGEPLQNTGYFKWSKGQPDNFKGSENCGSMFVNTGLLNDIVCATSEIFICEKDIPEI